MRAKGIWTVQSLFTCFLWNALLLGVLFYMATNVLQGLHQWVDPFLAAGASPLPEDVASAFSNLDGFIREMERYLAPVLFGTGGLATFFLWLFLLIEGGGLIRRAQSAPVLTSPGKEASDKTGKASQEKEVPPEPRYVQESPQAAVQMLAVLQREGRFIDFLQEDLSLYDDAQIGAAVRSIHQGCKSAITEYVELKPIYEEGEGVEVSVPADFDSRAVRLTGSVAGSPPFKGVLRHRGWRVARVQLPQPTSEQKKDWILAPAEVEVTE